MDMKSPTLGMKIKKQIRMLVYGNVTEEHRKIAKEKSGEAEPIIYEVVPQAYNKPEWMKPKAKLQRSKSELVETVKEIANQEDEGR